MVRFWDLIYVAQETMKWVVRSLGCVVQPARLGSTIEGEAGSNTNHHNNSFCLKQILVSQHWALIKSPSEKYFVVDSIKDHSSTRTPHSLSP